MENETPTDWSPERKIVGAAIAVIVLGLIQVVTQTEVPIGIEGALAVVVGYLLPNKKKTSDDSPNRD